MDTSPGWDKIDISEIYDLLAKVDDFYQARENPKLNVLWLVNLWLKRLRNDLDYYVNCEGQKGYGKSNLMLLLSILQARYSGIWENNYTKKRYRVLARTRPLPKDYTHIECGFQFTRNMSFLDDAKGVKLKYNSLDRYQPFVIDEGSKVLHKHRWMDLMQYELVRLSDTSRYQNKTFLVCFPHFSELNAAFRNDRIMMRLYVYHRDVNNHYADCIISLKDLNRYVPDPWHTDDNAKAYEEILKRTPPSLRNHTHVLYAEKKLKGYAGHFEFPELRIISPHIWSIYERYKKENAKRDETTIEGEEEKESERILKWKWASRHLVDWIVQKHPEMTYSEIAKVMGIATLTLTQVRTLKEPTPIIMRETEKMVSKLNSGQPVSS